MIIALAAATLFQIFYDGYLARFAFLLTLTMPILALIISLPAMLGCRISLSPQSAGVPRGDDAQWLITVANRFRLPLSRLKIVLKKQNCFTGAEEIVLLELSGLSQGRTVEEPAPSDHCGLLQCSAVRARVCDCLGLFALPVSLPKTANMLIMPTPADGETLPPALQHKMGRAPSSVPRMGVSAGEDYDLRGYRPGDPMHSVHWKLSSKLDSLVVRESSQDRPADIVLTFDHFGSPEELDRVMDRLTFVSRTLLARSQAHRVEWTRPLSGELRSFPVTDQREFDVCLAAVLADPAPLKGTPFLDNPPADDAEKRYVYIGHEEEATT